jgi:ATP-dependent Zn protease
MNDPEHTAVHEAGHAVVGRVLRLVCGSATIVAEGDSAGHHVVEDHYAAYAAWEAREIWRSVESAVRARIITFLAGAEAEVELLGSTQDGDGDDREQARMMMETLLGLDGLDADHALARLRRSASYLVRRHAGTIRAVADRLTVAGTVPGDELDRMVAGPLFRRSASWLMLGDDPDKAAGL